MQTRFSKMKFKYIRAGITKESSDIKRLMEDGVLKLIYMGRCNPKKNYSFNNKSNKKIKRKIQSTYLYAL